MKNLRTPKGTLDINPTDALTQADFIAKIKQIFEKHHGMPIVTPTFELRDILCNNYGEESKLIYNLENQGGDICSLRYDLTVPFSRYVSTYRIRKMRKYQIGNVFRRDNPSFETGRLREFIQADFDICGDGLPMLNDSEIIKIADEIMSNVGLNYQIRINDRRIINGILSRCNIVKSMHASVCSTIDKSDKMQWNDLEIELIEKGLSESQILEIKEFVECDGSNEIKLKWIKEKLMCVENEDKAENNDLIDECKAGIEEMETLLEYLEAYNVKSIKVDFSLARGLDYYTGMIFEVVLLNKRIGSVIGGGRYDGLTKKLSNMKTACVGFSVGVSRLCNVLKKVEKSFGVYVGSFHGLLVVERIRILEMLWKNNISAETFVGKRVNPKEQMEYANKNKFKTIVYVGENENANGKVVVIDLETGIKNEVEIMKIIDYFELKNDSN